MGTSLVIMVLQTHYERGLKKQKAANVNQSILLMILGCWAKDMLFWERCSVFVLTEKKRFWISPKERLISKIWEDPPKVFYYKKERTIQEDQTGHVK